MFDSRSPTVPERLELAVARLLLATASLRAPAVWCFTFAVALNALALIVPFRSGMLLTGPLIAVCGLIWLFIARTIIRSTMPSDLSVRDLLEGLGFVGAARGTSASDSKLAWALYIPLVLTLIPGWIGAITTAAVLIAAVWFVHQGQAGLIWAAIIFIVIGIALLAFSFVGTQALSVVCGIIALLGLIVLAFGTSGFDGIVKSFFRVEIVCAVAAVLVLLPLGVLGGLQYLTVTTVAIGGIIVPAGLLLVIYLLQNGAISRCRESTYELRKSLESVADLLGCEDQVRESDGYYRVCEPRYSHASSLAVGETGYIAWPEHDSIAFPIRDGEWCLARAVTSTTNPLLSGRDRIGEGVRRIFEVVAGGVVKMVGDKNLQSFVSRIFTPWHLRVFRGHDEREYLKMPWESGEVLAVPRNFATSFVYPTGCGIVDKDGLPCEVRSVRVQLTLRQAVVDDFDYAESQQVTNNPKNARPSVSLVWRVPLIIPAVYEGILRVLVSEMKNWSTLDPVDQVSLLSRIASRSQECLGTSLSALVSLQITSVDVAQIAVSEQDRDIHRKLDEFKRTMPGERIGLVSHLHNTVQRALRFKNVFILKLKVDHSMVEISKKLDDGIAAIELALAGGMRASGSDQAQANIVQGGVGEVRSTILSDSRKFKDELNNQRIRLIHALNEIDQAFVRSS